MIWACTRDFIISYGQRPLMNAIADVLSKSRDLKFGLSFHLHPYIVHPRSEGYGKSARMRRLVIALAADRCDTKRNCMHLPCLAQLIYCESTKSDP